MPRTSAADHLIGGRLRPRTAPARGIALATGLFLLVYFGWQLFGLIPGPRQHVGDLLILPVDVAAVWAAVWASRRCGGSARLRWFWRLMALVSATELIGDSVEAFYDLVLHDSPYPSVADLFYVAFYPLLLLALLRIPVPAVSREKRVKTVLDGATIVIGGGALVWYFVLGPTAVDGGQGPLAMAVSMAFPIGDLFLLAGLAAVLLRHSPVALRSSLVLITAALLLGVLADVLYGYGQLHNTYRAGDTLDTLYVLEFTAFALAGACQLPVRERDAEVSTDESGQAPSRASWLPYLSVAIALGVLLGVESSKPFFPDVSLVVIVIALTLLVAVRQYLAQRELIQAQRALRESERAKDEFLSVVGHELRSPLTSIRGSLGLLEGGVLGELAPDAANMVALAVVNTDRLVRLVDDILDIERMAAGRLLIERGAVDAQSLVSESIQVLQMMADAAGVEFRTHVAPVGVFADADRIVQALVNLLGNAIKFSSAGDLISVTVTRDGDCALFSVHDSGRGIPADRLQSIFERFRQVDASDAREKGGAGLGLPIARAIIDQHGGRMWAESEEGSGSTFRFTLPLAREARRGSRDGVGGESPRLVGSGVE